LSQAKNKQSGVRDERKRRAVQQMYPCAGWATVCERCSTPISACCHGATDKGCGRQIPYRFCDDCAEEYVDYVERLQGRGDDTLYWRNESWMEVWATWINHRAALDRHFRSKAFARLLEEMRNTPSGQED
jgi:hypothetical protein